MAIIVVGICAAVCVLALLPDGATRWLLKAERSDRRRGHNAPPSFPRVPVVQSGPNEFELVERWECDFQGVRWVIRKRFRFGASVPRVLRWLVDPYELSPRAGLIHDFIFHWKGNFPRGAMTPNRKLSHKDGDRIFWQIMTADGVVLWKRWAAWAAVRTLGGFAWRSDDLTDEDRRDYVESWEEAG